MIIFGLGPSFGTALYWLNIYLQRECEALKTMNSEMKIRLQAMEQQAQLKDGTFMPPTPQKKTFTVVHPFWNQHFPVPSVTDLYFLVVKLVFFLCELNFWNSWRCSKDVGFCFLLTQYLHSSQLSLFSVFFGSSLMLSTEQLFFYFGLACATLHIKKLKK